MEAEYPGALWVPNSNYFPNREGLTARYIILHGTAGGTSAESIANYFASTQGTANPASSHFVIGQDGEVVQCVSLADGAWANGLLTTGHDPWWDPNINPNDITVSIEHCKPSTDNSDTLTPAQEAASFKLVQWLCKPYLHPALDIPARAADANGGITGHYSIDPINRSRCPGPYPRDALWAFLKGATTTMLQITDPLASHFKARDDSYWECDNGLHVMGEILKYYRAVQAAPRLPVIGENQTAINGKPVTWQAFEAGIVVFDPSNVAGGPMGHGNCFMAKYSDDIAQNYWLKDVQRLLQTAQTQYKTAQATITQLQAQLAALTTPAAPSQAAIDSAASALVAIISGAQSVLRDLGKV